MDVLFFGHRALWLGCELVGLAHHRVDERVGILSEVSLCIRAGLPQPLVGYSVLLVIEHLVGIIVSVRMVMVMVAVVVIVVVVVMMLGVFRGFAARLTCVNAHARGELRLLVLAALYALRARRLVMAILPPHDIRLVYMHLPPDPAHASTPRTHPHTTTPRGHSPAAGARPRHARARRAP